MSYLFKKSITDNASSNVATIASQSDQLLPVSNTLQKSTLSDQQKLEMLRTKITDNLYQRVIKIIDILGSECIDFLVEILTNSTQIKNRVLICEMIERIMTGLQRYPDNNLKSPAIAELVKPLVNKFAIHAEYFISDLLFKLTNSFNQINPDVILIINGLLEDKDIVIDDALLKEKINVVFTYLMNSDKSDIAQLALLFKHKPYPNFDGFYKAINEHQTISLICNRADANPFNNRNPLHQFDEQQKQNLAKSLRAIKDVVRDENITLSHRNVLFDQYKRINAFNAKLAHLTREQLKQGLNETIMLLRQPNNQVTSIQLQNSIQNWQHTNYESAEGKILIARATLIAYLREIYYRTSSSQDQIYPDATQIICALQTIQSGGHVVHVTENTPDKTVTALQNAMLWCEGYTVDNCFDNLDDAELDKYRHADFFKYISAEVTLISDDSEVGQLSETGYRGPYKEHAINYSTKTKLALYRDKCALSAIDFRKIFNTPISINFNKLNTLYSENATQTILFEYSVNNLDYYYETPGARILGNITSRLDATAIQELHEKYQLQIYQNNSQMSQLQMGSSHNDQLNIATSLELQRIKRMEQVIRIVQKHLDKCLQALLISKVSHTEEAKNEFLLFRQNIVEDLCKKWNEIYTNFSSDPSMKPREKLNQVTEKFIKEVNQLWIKNVSQLKALSVPQELAILKVEDYLHSNNYRLNKDTVTSPIDDEYLNYYKKQIGNPKHNVKGLVTLFRTLNNSKISARYGRENIFAYQQANAAEMLTKAKTFMKDVLNEYLDRSWFKSGYKYLSRDRENCVKPLVEPGSNSIDNQNNFLDLLKKINATQLDSFKTDCAINSSLFSIFFHRHESKLRNEVIFNSKRYLFSVCPPAELVQVAKQELVDLQNYLNHSLTANPVYTDDSEVKKLLRSLINTLPISADANFDPTEKLAIALTKLKQIIKHPDYSYSDPEDSVSGLDKIALSLNYLYDRTKNVSVLKDSQYQQAYKTVNKLLHKLNIQEPSIFCMFSNSFYQIPVNQNIFPDVLNQVANPKEKYYLHEIMKQVKDKLTNKYGAYHVEFTYENSKLSIKFKLMDEKTLVTTANEIAIHVDIKNKTYICEPVISGTTLEHPNMHVPNLAPRLD